MIPRYTLPRMGDLFTDQRRFERWLEVELATCDVLHEEGRIPSEEHAEIKQKAGFDVGEIETIEREVHHDVIAFTTSVARRVGPASRYFHLGLTSSDVVDTAFSMALIEALAVLASEVEKLASVVRNRAREHARTPIMGRTHGVHAEPTTFGLKLAIWYQELERHRARLTAARREVAVGKISGAVGNYAALSPALEERILGRLGLEADPVSSQIIQRDRHASVMATLAGVASSIEKFALEVRLLARSEVREVEEPFAVGQKGSSAMPHKRNPVVCERLCGLARLVRSHALVAFENVALWHERDISHSCAERVIFPDAFITLHYMVVTFSDILQRLTVRPERMRANMDSSGGVVFSGTVLIALAKAGLTREEAYRIVQGHAHAALDGGAGFRERLGADPRVTQHLEAARLDECFRLEPFLEHVDEVLDRALA